MTPKIRPAVAAVVVRDERVLLVEHTGYDAWVLPSGRIEPGESVREATRREVAEEAGIEVEVEHLVGVYSDPAVQTMTRPDGERYQFVTCCCRCVSADIDAEPQPDGEETVAAEFRDPEDLPADFEPMDRWVADALDGRMGVLR